MNSRTLFARGQSMAATIVNKITNKDLEIEPSDFNEIGAKSRLTIKEE